MKTKLGVFSTPEESKHNQGDYYLDSGFTTHCTKSLLFVLSGLSGPDSAAHMHAGVEHEKPNSSHILKKEWSAPAPSTYPLPPAPQYGVTHRDHWPHQYQNFVWFDLMQILCRLLLTSWMKQSHRIKKTAFHSAPPCPPSDFFFPPSFLQ